MSRVLNRSSGRRARSITSAILGCVMFVGTVVAWHPPAASAETGVAVVNMVRLIQAHPQTQTLDARFKQARDQAKLGYEATKTTLDALRKEIEMLARGKPERTNKERAYQKQLTHAEFAYKWELKVAVDRYVSALEETYQSIRATVAQHARMHNIKVVLQQVDPSAPLNAADPQEFGMKQRLRNVVYFDNSVDITDAVLADIKKRAGANNSSRVPEVGSPPR